MKFTYSNLKTASKEGMRIGNWKGKGVFACSSGALDRKGSGAFYILYDDENKLVGNNNGNWYCYGTVSEGGNVDEYSTARRYTVGYAVAYEQPHAVCGKSAKECNGTAAPTAEEVMGDVKLGLDVEATLKAAREMTVENLLEGFNYGLD